MPALNDPPRPARPSPLGRSLAGCAAALLLAGVVAAQPATSAPARETLGSGDTVRITVFQSPELGSELRLSDRGTVVFPLLGEVALGGLTPEEAGALIGQRLREGRLVTNPQVGVAVLQVRSRQVSVLGHVVRPGRYALDGPRLRLTDLLALAGGIGPEGGGSVTVISAQRGEVRKLEVDLHQVLRGTDLSQDLELLGGEIVFVERAPVFYVYGQVQRAGAQRLDPDTSVLRALSLGGGLTPRGTQRGLQIHRRMPDGSLRVIDARLADRVEADDILYVKERLF